jgi:glycerophosphoryl diester phosphodiesterase
MHALWANVEASPHLLGWRSFDAASWRVVSSSGGSTSAIPRSGASCYEENVTHPYLSLEHPIRFAHRGSRVLWPENTMVAFDGAAAMGCSYLEIDVQMTMDGTVVVFHDAALDRVTNGVGEVNAWLWDDVQLLDAAWSFAPDRGHPMRASGVRIPSLDELFTTFSASHINIDLKSPRMEWAVADLIKRHNRQERTLIGSFRRSRLARFRRIVRGTVPTSASPERALATWAASRVGATTRGPEIAYQVPFEHPLLRLDQRYVDAIHAIGAHVHIWTVNDGATMHRLLDMGVDGIVTDRPDVLNDVLAQRS